MHYSFEYIQNSAIVGNNYKKNIALVTHISLAPFHLSTGNLKLYGF